MGVRNEATDGNASGNGVGRRAVLRRLSAGTCVLAWPAAARVGTDKPRLYVRAGITGSTFVQPPEDHPTRRTSDLAGFRPGSPEPRTRFGGFGSGRTTTSSFFAVERIGKRWWLRDPDGGRFLSIGINSVDPRRGGAAGRAAYARRFGSDAAWATETLALLRATGINTAGAWSDPAALAAGGGRIADCPNLGFLAAFGRTIGGTHAQPGHVGFAHNAVPVFDPRFVEFCDRHAAGLADRANDPWLLGYFTDNELPLGDRMLDDFLAAPVDDPAHRGAMAWLAGRDPARIDGEMRDRFRAYVIDRYYATVTTAIRRHDPNHLIFGTRFYGDEKDSATAFRASGRYLDAVAVNVYHEWTPDIGRMRRWSAWSGRPVLVSEFYAKGEDAGLSNRGGAGWTVATQADRGLFYENFVLGLIEAGVCIGWHWHRYMDEPAPARPHPWNGGSNKGLVGTGFAPYPPLAAMMREVNRDVPALARYFDT
ncbi:hypothetical protein [Sphingomonas sp. VNH70]|uniref:hypothetical protein n=1 Tax=Sphingomonas silueang TaxID=3156617 RepID=UPI0032B5E4C1